MSNNEELNVLMKLQHLLRQAKQELKNDLTRLAVKKMPLMIEQPSTSQVEEIQLPINIDEDPNNQLVELEPLDLDIE